MVADLAVPPAPGSPAPEVDCRAGRRLAVYVHVGGDGSLTFAPHAMACISHGAHLPVAPLRSLPLALPCAQGASQGVWGQASSAGTRWQASLTP